MEFAKYTMTSAKQNGGKQSPPIRSLGRGDPGETSLEKCYSCSPGGSTVTTKSGTEGNAGRRGRRSVRESWRERGSGGKRSQMQVGTGQEVEDNGEKKMNKEIPFCKKPVYPAHILQLQNF